MGGQDKCLNPGKMVDHKNVVATGDIFRTVQVYAGPRKVFEHLHKQSGCAVCKAVHCIDIAPNNP